VATAIKNNLCTGCNRLELLEFKGLKECKYAQSSIKQINEILGIQTELKLRMKKNF